MSAAVLIQHKNTCLCLTVAQQIGMGVCLQVFEAVRLVSQQVQHTFVAESGFQIMHHTRKE